MKSNRLYISISFKWTIVMSILYLASGKISQVKNIMYQCIGVNTTHTSETIILERSSLFTVKTNVKRVKNAHERCPQ